MKVLQPDEELARTIIPFGSSRHDAVDAIDDLMADAERRALDAGCQPYEYRGDETTATDGLTLIYRRAELRTGDDWYVMSLEERLAKYHEFLAATADEATARTATRDVAITVTVSDHAVPRRRPAIIEIDVHDVEPAIARGVALAAERLPADASENDIGAACRQLVMAARDRAEQDFGLIWPREAVRDLTYDELNQTIAEVAHHREELGLDSRLSVVVTRNCLNIEEPEFRIDVDPIRTPSTDDTSD